MVSAPGVELLPGLVGIGVGVLVVLGRGVDGFIVDVDVGVLVGVMETVC